MPQKIPQDQENDKLGARIRELEGQLELKDKSAFFGSRSWDSWSNATRSKRDSANRTARGLTMASIESVRLLADAVSSFAHGVVLPGDIVGSFADTVTKLVQTPAQSAKKYSSAYDEGQKTT